MISANPYLNFPGTCAEAFKAYETILGGKILAMMKAEDPAMGGADFVGMIMHARLKVGDTLIMGSDAPPSRFKTPRGFSVSIMVDTPTEADRIYAALAEGGTQTMPIGKTFWALRFGMCVDRFGIAWMINCEAPAS